MFSRSFPIGLACSQVALLIRAVLAVRDAELQEHHSSHDREKNPAGQHEDVEEVALHDQRSLFSLEIRLKIKQVVAGADFARMAETNAGDDDCEGEISDEDQGLHRIDEGPLRL